MFARDQDIHIGWSSLKSSFFNTEYKNNIANAKLNFSNDNNHYDYNSEQKYIFISLTIIEHDEV